MLIKNDPESRLARAQDPDYVKAVCALFGCLLEKQKYVSLFYFGIHIIPLLQTYSEFCAEHIEHEYLFKDSIAYLDEHYDEQEARLLDAMTYIIEDGFDITGYELFEIPDEWVFVFTKEEDGHFYEFNICVDPYPEEQTVEVYPCDIHDSWLRRQPSIKEAVFLAE